MRIIKVNRARIEISCSTCCDCGRELDSDAREAGTVGLSVAGIQRSPIQLWRCAKCHGKMLADQVIKEQILPHKDAMASIRELAENAGKDYGIKVTWLGEIKDGTLRCPYHGTMLPCTLEHEVTR